MGERTDGTEAATVTIEFTDETAVSLEGVALTDYDGDRAAAIRGLLDKWLDDRCE